MEKTSSESGVEERSWLMDGDSGDEENDERMCVRSDKSDKSSWTAGRRSSLGS